MMVSLSAALADLEVQGVDTSRPALVAIAEKALPKVSKDWSQSSFVTWLKIQAIKCGFIERCDGGQMPLEFGPTATMHVFFLHLLESPEMICRLRNERVIAGNGPARSRITNETEIIQPIDATAARVVTQK